MASYLNQVSQDFGWSAIRTNDKLIVVTLNSPGSGAYNQWASISQKFQVNGGSEIDVGTFGVDETRINEYGMYIQRTMKYFSSVTDSSLGGGDGRRYLTTGVANTNKWTGRSSSSSTYRNTLNISNTTYELHGQCWSWIGTPWPQVRDGYVFARLTFNKPSNFSSFNISTIEGTKRIKITAPNTNGLYNSNGDQAMTVDSNGVGYLTNSYSGTTVYAVPSYASSSSDTSSTVIAGASVVRTYYVNFTPCEYCFTWKKFAPSITRNNRTLTINCSPWPSNGFTVYRDNVVVHSNWASSTYTIPVADMVGRHSWRVVANQENYVTNLSYMTYYATYDADTSKWIAYRYRVSGDAYWGSDSSNTISYTYSLDTPTITISERADVRSWKISWNAVTNAVSYSVKLDNGSWTSVSTNLTKTWTGLSQGTHTFSVRANYSTSTYNSGVASTQGTLDIIPQPYNLVFNRGGVNVGTLSWSTQYPDTADTVYAIYDGTIRIAATNNTSYTLSNLSQGAHVFGVVQEYAPDSGYNSNKSTISYIMSKLKSPASIILADIRGNVYQVPGDPSSPVVSSNGKVGIKLTYPTSDTYQGITYKLYNNTFTSVGTELPDTDGDRETTSSKTMYWNTREPAYGTVGKHRVYPQAVFEDDHNYDSVVVFTKDATTSNPATAYVDYDINTLSSPTLVWNGNNESSRIYESYLTWLPSTAQSENGDYPDYYICYTIANGDIARTPLGNIYTILQPENKTERLGVWIPDPQPFTDAVYGLIPQMPSAVGTTTYAVCVSSCSYSPWYVGTSTASETTYQIIRLGTPTNILWDVDHWTLSWSPVLNATHYYLYDNGADITPYPDDDNSPRGITGTQYTFDALGAGLHRFQVSALKITTETVA